MEVSNLYLIEWTNGADKYIAADSFSEAETNFLKHMSEMPESTRTYNVNITNIKLVGKVIHQANHIKYNTGYEVI